MLLQGAGGQPVKEGSAAHCSGVGVAAGGAGGQPVKEGSAAHCSGVGVAAGGVWSNLLKKDLLTLFRCRCCCRRSWRTTC